MRWAAGRLRRLFVDSSAAGPEEEGALRRSLRLRGKLFSWAAPLMYSLTMLYLGISQAWKDTYACD